MKYNFDKVIDREGSDCIKWDHVDLYFGKKDLLPMWVADMDFEVPKEINEAIKKRTEHGVYGYTKRPDSFYYSLINWTNKRHNWDIKKEWIIYTPGVVPAINIAINAYTKPGDKVIIQSPVYFPFSESVKNNGRQLIDNELKLENGRYVMDFEDLEKKIDSRVKLLILCSPHNPIGRVWNEEELKKLGEICLKNDILIVSDEIHSDIIYKGSKHIPISNISNKLANNTITCLAPSKTFNIAGLSASSIIIPNEKLRIEFNKEIDNLHIGMANIFGMVALEAAYNYGEKWLEELLEYLEGNVKFVMDFIDDIPNVNVIRPEGTYLMWIDFNGLELNDEKLKDLIINKAKVALNDGEDFGPGGKGFKRMNIACPRSILKEGLERIAKAVKEI
ncbi:MAG: pyridoxal phosphate-dependent aminotransferase [Firmicutes bacterium]|nr:pyridoxal phosphate-dependent aminotransferase [Bacillota bacterium]